MRFPEEKVRHEVAMMRYLSANTTIPVPKIYHHGTAAENPTGLGPFIIMDYVDHDVDLSDSLNDPTLAEDDPQTLDPDIDEQKLEKAYGQMAKILLELSTLSFSRIGSLTSNADGSCSVSARPITQYMNSLAGWLGVGSTALPSGPYSTDKEWYCALADMHFRQLALQSNEGIEDEDDARNRFVARRLFQKIAYDGRLIRETSEGESQPTFRIYSEDFRPTNVLIDKDSHITGVIDWEFAYAAPAAFSSDPPWWLLLKKPEDWPGGFEAWMEAYEPRLQVFLRVLEDEEGKPGYPATDSSTPLTQRMRQSWENKTWIINYAARNGLVFDHVYWKYLDSRFFGPNKDEDYRARLSLLTEEEIEEMGSYVKRKMKEKKGRNGISDGGNTKGVADQLALFTL